MQHLGRSGLGFDLRHAAQDRVDPQQQFLGFKRFDKEIIRTRLKPFDTRSSVETQNFRRSDTTS